jgi:phosphoglycolate phosphatase
MISYTSAKSVVDFGYRYRGRWIAAGRGRDIRLFQLFIGGLMTYFHPIFALLTVLIIAVQTNAIVLRRIFLSWNWSRKGHFLIKGKIEAVIFDFDGTVANTMPFLTELAVKLMTEKYNISRHDAQKRYLENTGMDFASQIELIFPGHPSNHDVVSRFESMREKDILAYPLFPEVVPAFKYFVSKKVRIFVCSSTRQEIVERYVRLYKIENLLESFLGYRAGFGKGEQIAFIVQNYKFNPKEVLFVGDSLKDIDYVKDKGTAFIGIARMFGKEDFERIGASSVSSLTDLVRLFEEHEKYSNYFEEVR